MNLSIMCMPTSSSKKRSARVQLYLLIWHCSMAITSSSALRLNLLRSRVNLVPALGPLSYNTSLQRNYPLLMATWKVAPALAAGCTAVLKPSELASVTCLELADVCKEVGLPSGVLNVVTGLGPEAGAPLSSHPDVDKVAFTGSYETGKKIMIAAAPTVKPVTLELGGKSPIVVFDDVDIDKGSLLMTMFYTSMKSIAIGWLFLMCHTSNMSDDRCQN